MTPALPQGRLVIQRYGPDGFRVGGVEYTQPVLVFPDRVELWPVANFAAVDAQSLHSVVEHGAVEILLIGCGRRMQMPPPGLRPALKARGISLDLMDTGAVCRTYNVLVAEDRRVAAAMLPIRWE